ncbi:MAG TPA: polyprenyl synthetase family protein [Rhodospirillales bacterium]|nr:polyprenyl synthetase family protein [Rhodospirillales bacterium]HIL76536.1 polyprenyl synthetase family protein [Rhodospirillales bacterium]
MTEFTDALADVVAATETALLKLIPVNEGPESQVFQAMRYSVMAGGKRLRPFLVIASADLFNVSRSSSERVAAAVEMIHTYSLIHDDLPAMDDDNLRRGEPTCHLKFDEATAILAGDALLTLAFEVIAHSDTHDSAKIRADLVLEISHAVGAQGMVGGQILDLFAEKNILGMPEITRLQRMKTGALINCSCQSGAILGKASETQRHLLNAYAYDIGLAFQITDDLLDIDGHPKELGKAINKDTKAGKATFVSQLGVERARSQAVILTDQAIKHLDIFGEKAGLLRDLARFVIERDN